MYYISNLICALPYELDEALLLKTTHKAVEVLTDSLVQNCQNDILKLKGHLMTQVLFCYLQR